MFVKENPGRKKWPCMNDNAVESNRMQKYFTLALCSVRNKVYF